MLNSLPANRKGFCESKREVTGFSWVNVLVRFLSMLSQMDAKGYFNLVFILSGGLIKGFRLTRLPL